MSNPPQRNSTAGAKSQQARNLQWLEEIKSGQATVRQIADREFVTPGAVRKALKLAKQARAFSYGLNVPGDGGPDCDGSKGSVNRSPQSH